MSKRVLVGIGAGLLASALVVGVATAGFKAGRERGRETVAVTDGETVRVVDDDHWGRGPGFGFGFLVFPLLVTGLVVLAVSRRPHAGPGWWGPGGWGPGGWGPGGPEGALAEWHRRAHEAQEAGASPPAGGSAGSGGASG